MLGGRIVPRREGEIGGSPGVGKDPLPAERSWGLGSLDDFDCAFSPDGLAAYAGPGRGLQVREEFPEVALVGRLADETAQGMGLAGASADSIRFHAARGAGCHGYAVGTLAQGSVINLE